MASSVAEYAEFASPFGSVAVVTTGGCGTILIDRVAVAFEGVVAESATCTIKLSAPCVVGVPEMAPVLGTSVSPGGRLPAATLHV